VVGTERHGVRVASVGVVEVSSSHYSGALKPVPRSVFSLCFGNDEKLIIGTDLSSVTSIGIAVTGSTASSGISSGQERSELAIGLDAESVIVGLGGSMGPAGSTVSLIPHVSDNAGTLGPLYSGVEGFGGFNCQKGLFRFNG